MSACTAMHRADLCLAYRSRRKRKVLIKRRRKRLYRRRIRFAPIPMRSRATSKWRFRQRRFRQRQHDRGNDNHVHAYPGGIRRGGKTRPTALLRALFGKWADDAAVSAAARSARPDLSAISGDAGAVGALSEHGGRAWRGA